MERRRFLETVAIGAATVGVAGCAESSKPDPEPREGLRPTPNMVSVDTESEEYFATIHNTGDAGTIRTELHYFKNQNISNPNQPESFDQSSEVDREFDSARSHFFDGDERRQVTMSATQQNRWDGEFGIIPFVESYGAIFENQGESGEIEFTFEIAEDTDYDINSPPRQIEFVESGEQVEVMFNILLPEGVEYEIIGESA